MGEAWAVEGTAAIATVGVIAVPHSGSRKTSATKRRLAHRAMGGLIMSATSSERSLTLYPHREVRGMLRRIAEKACHPCEPHSTLAAVKEGRMNRKYWRVVAESVCVGWLIAGNLLGDAWGAENRGVTWHHQAAGLTATLITQPGPPRASENFLRVDLTDVKGQPIPHAQVRLVLAQMHTMPGMHNELPQEIEAPSTHVGVYVGRAHLATPGRWEVIVKVGRPRDPATEAVFYLDVQPT
jgi:hypothetical protein